MNLSSFRAKAREKLSGKWGKAACITLAYMAINFIFNTILSYSFNGLNTILSIGFAQSRDISPKCGVSSTFS